MIQGLCQGNGAALACWLMLSYLLLHCYDKNGYGLAILSPISQELIAFLGNMYVDDTNLVVTKPHIQTASDVWEELQERVTEILKYILWVYETKLRLHFPHNEEEYRPAGAKPHRVIPPTAHRVSITYREKVET